jgi:integrase
VKPLEEAACLVSILRAIAKADLSPGDAMSIVKALKERDLVDYGAAKAKDGKEKLIPFLLRFWDPENSPYLTDLFAHGHTITLRHCRDAKRNIERHWKVYFDGTVSIGSVTRAELKAFSLTLFNKGLAAGTINNIMGFGTAALKWAATEQLIPSDPTKGLVAFTGDEAARGILTEKELETLFSRPWKDGRARAAAIVSLTTGIRSGEARALRRSSIREDTLDISYSWNDTEGLKCPKNGEARLTPLQPEVREMLLGLLEESPWQGGEDPFIFYGAKPGQPCSSFIFVHYLHEAIESTEGTDCEIDIAGRKIDFHSFRHAYAARMSGRLASDKVAEVTGHKSEKAAKIYQDHLTERVLREARKEAAKEFSSILKFAGRKTG